MALELQNLLRSGGVHPVGDVPVLVTLGVARPAWRQHIDQSPGGSQCPSDVALSEQVRLVASNEQNLTDDIGCGGSRERERNVADVDGVNASVGRQRAFQVRGIHAQRHGVEVDAHHAGEAKDHPLQA
jgi:hypothetical protein